MFSLCPTFISFLTHPAQKKKTLLYTNPNPIITHFSSFENNYFSGSTILNVLDKIKVKLL